MNGEDYAKIAFEQGYDSSMMLEAISNKGALAPVASAATETQTYSEDMVQNLLQTIEERGRLSLPEISETAKLLGYPAVTASDLSTSLDGYMLFRRERNTVIWVIYNRTENRQYTYYRFFWNRRKWFFFYK